MRRLAAVMLLWVALPATALAAPERERDRGGPIAAAREQHGATKPDERVAGGAITVEPTEGLAGVTRTVTVTLASGEAGVSIDYPDQFQARAINGRAYVTGRPAGAALGPADRSVSIDVSRLPGGTYRLPVRRGRTVIGTAVFRLYVGEREGDDEGDRLSGAFGPLGRNPIDSSGDSTEESETFVAAEPDNAQRFATYGNDISFPGFGGLNVTNNGGASFAHLTFPTVFDVKGSSVDETAQPSGDPILAADAAGNIWAGGLNVCTVGADRIFVNRIAGPSGTTPSPKNVGLPIAHGGTICSGPKNNAQLQDKPQMTLDTTPTSPTFGRLYVTWDDPAPGGGVNVVTSYCDTQPNPVACDSADKWTDPTKISDAGSSQGGSYITSDPAVGPDGKVYVAWWDFSGANAVRIDTCDPAAHTGLACNATGDWGTDQIVASLTFHDGVAVPFACPMLAQPGGRAAPVPSLAVDHASGRIYAAWSDLSTKGDHRCTDLSDEPDSTQDTFKSYVASAPGYATLTADPTTLSHERGTNVIGEAGDHWFPWVAVDQSRGQAYVDLYSTRDDATRESARFYARAVVPGAGSTRVSYGPLTAVSSDATNYSDEDCCGFGNDYGDYTGLDAAAGNVYAVWTHRLLGQDGDVYINLLPASAVPASPTEVPFDDAIDTGPPPPPPPPTTTTATSTTPTLPPGTTPTITPPPITAPSQDRTPPRLNVTYARRVDRKGRYTVKFAASGEAAAGTVRLRLATGARRTLASGLLATSGRTPFGQVLRLKTRDLRLLKRKRRLRVTVAVSLTDLSGNTAKGHKTFTLRLRR